MRQEFVFDLSGDKAVLTDCHIGQEPKMQSYDFPRVVKADKERIPWVE